MIGLQSTGEARTLEQLERDEGELTDFVSTAKGVFQTLVEKHFPAPDRNRIHRLLGLELPSNSKKTTSNGTEEANSSSGKRKPGNLVSKFRNFVKIHLKTVCSATSGSKRQQKKQMVHVRYRQK